MSEILAHYSFLPWVRQGLGNQIIEADTLGDGVPNNPALERPEVQITADLEASKGDSSTTEVISRTVKIQGPGDVLGINQKTIIRVHPKKGVTNFETNNLAYIEFYEEDLPWRFTPASPTGNKLRPWLSLVVLKEDEFTRQSGSTPTPFIAINDKATLSKVFCNEKDIAALAHVHVLEDIEPSNGESNSEALLRMLDVNPDVALSRVLCPRKLEHDDAPGADNTYHAFLIPSFETGRLAGMGEDTNTTPAQEASWKRSEFNGNSHPLSYPYYYSWSFDVGANGDFESLAQLLEARELPENIGKREMELRELGFGIDPTDDADVIGFVEGAMRHPDFATAEWPASESNEPEHPLRKELRDILNLSADLQDLPVGFDSSRYFYSPDVGKDPIITPPTYGKWHGGAFKLASSTEDWVHEINLHPSHRAAAGLGTQVVQQHQEDFMEMAWEQIGEINEANQKIIENELAKRVSNALLNKKIYKLNETDRITVLGPTLSVLDIGGETAKSNLVHSKVPTAVRSGTFTKVANKAIPKVDKLANPQVQKHQILDSTLINNLNTAAISAAPVREEPASAISVFVASGAINYVLDNPPLAFMQKLALSIKAEGPSYVDKNVIDRLTADYNCTQPELDRADAILKGRSGNPIVIPNNADYELEIIVEGPVFEIKVNETYHEAIYEKVKFTKKVEQQLEQVIFFNHLSVIDNRIDFKTQFQSVFSISEVNGLNVSEQFNRPILADLQLDFSKSIVGKILPLYNFNRKLNILFNPEWQNLQKPIMAYPRFPIPMYDYLKDISPDYIIPNISEIEPNTMTLMEPNKHFIEAFLTGMNHEFSRELLWREFPTDMRGSYFRHFWEYDNDPRNEIPKEPVETYVDRLLEFEDDHADIKELHQWKANNFSRSKLGENHTGGPELVLLIKGELFKKYPNTLVYAQKAEFDSNGNHKPRKLTDYNDEENVQWPIITGKMEPDVYFFGFTLTEEEAEGNRTNDAGWFFVLRERPGQISFGLDDLDDENSVNDDLLDWNQVTWEHITNNDNQQPDFLEISDVSISLDPPPQNYDGPRDANWNKNAANMAYILYQSPILFARHASTML